MRPAALVVLLALAGCGSVPSSPGVNGDDAGVSAVSDADASAADAPRPRDVSMGDAADAPLAVDAPGDAPGAAPMDAPRDAPDDVGEGDAAVSRCPPEMVLVEGRVCVDRWEAALEEIGLDGGVQDWSPYHSVEGHRVRATARGGAVPQGYISGEQSAAACRLAGKRLCALDEWVAACRGPAHLVYPYGDTYVHRRCNEGRTPHPVVQYFGTSVGVFDAAHMNDPGINMQADTVARSGMFTGCVSPWGLYDMVGNMHEWIAGPPGVFKGGFYVDAEINGHGCLYTTTAHAFSYHDYSTGFRCCADPR